jgi:hypothetical protein
VLGKHLDLNISCRPRQTDQTVVGHITELATLTVNKGRLKTTAVDCTASSGYPRTQPGWKWPEGGWRGVRTSNSLAKCRCRRTDARTFKFYRRTETTSSPYQGMGVFYLRRKSFLKDGFPYPESSNVWGNSNPEDKVHH